MQFALQFAEHSAASGMERSADGAVGKPSSGCVLHHTLRPLWARSPDLIDSARLRAFERQTNLARTQCDVIEMCNDLERSSEALRWSVLDVGPPLQRNGTSAERAACDATLQATMLEPCLKCGSPSVLWVCREVPQLPSEHVVTFARVALSVIMIVSTDVYSQNRLAATYSPFPRPICSSRHIVGQKIFL
jgi:hypothetical protein